MSYSTASNLAVCRANLAVYGQPDEMPTDDLESLNDELEDLPQLSALDFCQKKIDANGDPYYAFQVITARLETNAIRIGPHFGVKCRCGINECQHVQWLLRELDLDQLRIDQRIAFLGLENICEDRQWEYRPEEAWDSRASIWELRKSYARSVAERQSHSTFLARKQAARDIMATFSHEQVFEEFRYDVFDQGDGALLKGEVYQPKDLSATLCRMLIRNDEVDYHFRHLMPCESRDIDYFNKMYLKGERAVHCLDEYADTGLENNWSALTPACHLPSFPHDVPWCGQELVNITHYVMRRCGRKGISRRAKEVAADVMMHLLRKVVKKNHSTYREITWARRAPHAERTSNSNLFQHLLGPDSGTLSAQGKFIIEGLELIPDTCVQHIEELERVLVLLGQAGFDAPALYRERLKKFITKLKGGASSVQRPSSSTPSPDGPPRWGQAGASSRGRGEGKRSGGSSDRKGKRRMVER